MDIFLYDNNKQDFIKFPVIPKEININSKQKIENFETITYGDLKLIGLKGNRKLSLDSFFPKTHYGFSKDRKLEGMQYVDKIEKWRETRTPLVLLISDLNINFKCVIDNLDYSIKDGTGDIYYKMSIEEFKVPTIKTQTNPSSKKPVTVSKPEVVVNKSTYGIVTADVLNVRSGNGINYSIIGSLKKNTKVKLFRLEGGGKWWHIYFGNKGGHVSAQYIRRI